MNTGLKRIASILLILTFLLSCSNVFAVGTRIKVRIEGLNDTLYDRYVTVTDEVYGEDLLYSAIGENNVDGSVGDFGLMINGILGEQASWPNPYWSLYTVDGVNTESSLVGISSLKVSDIGNEMLLHVTEASWPSKTAIADVDIINDGNNYTVTVSDDVYDIESVTVDMSYSDVLQTNSDGQVQFTLDEGIYDIDIYKDGVYPEIIRHHYKLEVGDAANTIANTVNDMTEYYNNMGEYGFREALAINAVSESIEELKDVNLKYQPNDTSSASNCAGSIMGLIAAGYDPESYNGINYVQELISSQNEEGKFIIGDWDDYSTTVAYSILALDMAEAEYNEEKAVEALLSYAGDNGSFGDVDSTSMCLTALSNHKDIEGVEEVIADGLTYIKSKQLDTGGFESGGIWSTGSQNPYSTVTVIQALVANNINPLSADWTVNGNTMLAALVTYKEGNHFKYKSSYGTDVSSITAQAFTALADLYRGRSLYKDIKGIVLELEEDFNFERIGTEEFNLGEEAKITMDIANNASDTNSATVVVALYNTESTQMTYYNYFQKEFDPGENEQITSGLLIPDSGDYQIRCFLWDNMEDMNVLAEPVFIDVQ